MQAGRALLDGRLVDLHLRDRLVVRALVVVDGVTRHDAMVEQALVALVADLRVREARLILLQLRLGVRQVRGILVHHHLVGARIDLGAQLAGLHRGVVVAVAGLDGARDVRAHLHGDDGIDRTGRRNGANDRSRRELGGDVVRLRGVPPPQEIPQRARRDQPQRDGPRTGVALHRGRPPLGRRAGRAQGRGNTGKRYALGCTRDGSSSRSDGGARDRVDPRALPRPWRWPAQVLCAMRDDGCRSYGSRSRDCSRRA